MVRDNPISSFEKFLAKKYSRGTVIETDIVKIINPSQVITTFDQGFIGRLSLMDISWCYPDAEEQFQKLKVGDRIKAVVIAIDFESKQVKLSQRVLNDPKHETIQWDRIERGDEFNGFVIDEFNTHYLIKTEKGLFGLLNKSLTHEKPDRLKVRVHSKLDNNDLLSFVPSSLEVEQEVSFRSEIKNEFNFIEEDLISYYSFNKSLLGGTATNDEHQIIKNGFDADPSIFSKEISSQYTLYIQFELNSPLYEVTFKQNAIPYFFKGEVSSDILEKQLLEKLSGLTYWFRINQRNNPNSKNETITEFSLYNEDINFFGEVTISKDKKEYKFAIKNFSFGHNLGFASDAKKRNAKFGSFLFANPVVILSPFGTIPLGNKQKDFFDYALLKTTCFEIVNRLKKDSGEILKQEGKTLAIIDKFLEYQISLIDQYKESNILVERFEKIPSHNNGVSIKVPLSVASSLEIDEEAIVVIRVKKPSLKLDIQNELVYFKSAKAITKPTYLEIYFNGEVNLDTLNKGFYVDKKTSKTQLDIQRDIIQDFLNKKIKIDHIESLLVQPDKIKTPILTKVDFRNPDLKRAEQEEPDNNQVKAVKKAIGNQNIFLIQGPPGTGKTTVIAEIIEQLSARGEKILVAGQNHVAVDNVLEKISSLHHLNLLRVGNPEKIDSELVRYTLDNLVEHYKSDFHKFLLNQAALTKEYLKLKLAGESDDMIKNTFNILVNQYIKDYERLGAVFKNRHFNLRQTLTELDLGEIHKTIESLEAWIGSIDSEFELLLKPIIYNSVDVIFATCIGIKTDSVFKDLDFKFDTVIIDEAGKANIAETLVAVELGRKVILVGDQMQLPPYIDSSLIDEKEPTSFPKSQFGSGFTQDEIVHALKTSFFEFIINRIKTEKFPKENLEMLNYQHRMHPNIGEFVSSSFYDGNVRMGSRTHLNRLPLPPPFNKEVIFFDTSNAVNPFEQTDGYSARNNTEAESISEIILPKLFDSNVSPSDIAIIAPYKSQVENIKNYIRNSSVCNFKQIDVSTLDSFQGKEYNIIVFSFTRSTDHKKPQIINGQKKFTKVGFLDDARRLNVAFSRAKQKLILVGNSQTLTDSRSHYDGLFNYTQLFRKLVELSNKEKIGNFVNIADHHNFKTPFESFCEKYKLEDEVIGTVKHVGKKSNVVFGLFIKIDKVDCLLPASLMPNSFRNRLETIEIGSSIKVAVLDINKTTSRVTVMLPKIKSIEQPSKSRAGVWDENIQSLKLNAIVSGVVKTKTNFGFFIQLECGLDGLLHNNNVKGKTLEINQTLKVRVIKIDKIKKQIALSL